MSDPSSGEDEQPAGDDTITLSDVDKRLHPQEDDTESLPNGCLDGAPAPPSATSPPPADITPFDWEDFEARYESALKEADGEEKEILKEAESLSKVPSPSLILVRCNLSLSLSLLTGHCMTVLSGLGICCFGT